MPRGRKLHADEPASGRFVVRLPTGLHAHLATEAARQDTSLNQLVVAMLAAASRWTADDQTDPPTHTPASPRES